MGSKIVSVGELLCEGAGKSIALCPDYSLCAGGTTKWAAIIHVRGTSFNEGDGGYMILIELIEDTSSEVRVSKVAGNLFLSYSIHNLFELFFNLLCDWQKLWITHFSKLHSR